MDAKDFYSFVKLTDLKLPLAFRISSLEGIRKRKPLTELLEHPEARHWGLQATPFPDLYVVCQLWAENKPLTVPYRTAYKPFKTNHAWSEWIHMPLKLCDLPLNAQVTFTIYDIAGPRETNVVGGTTFRLFGKKGTLKKGKHRLFVWKEQEADGMVDTATPSKVGLKDEMGRLEKLVKKHERGDIPRMDWLDKLAFRQIEKIHTVESESSETLFLYIDMPRFDFPVVFCEAEGPPPILAAPATSSNPAGPSPAGPSSQAQQIDSSIFTVVDPDIARENPVEAKYRRLVRSHRSGPLDRELKPNAKLRDELNEILCYPPTKPLTPEEKDLIWKFRFYLTRDKKALTKFMKSVVWTDESEVKQAVEVLLPMWTDPELDDALELLGPGFTDVRVRNYAVRQLERADDEELLLYLLQLVQALKFDHLAAAATTSSDHRRTVRGVSTVSPSSSTTADESGLADFLIKRSLRNPVLGNNFHWYLMVECEDKAVGKMYGKVAFKFMTKMMQLPDGAERRDTLRRQGEMIATLSTRAKELRLSKDPRPKKIDKLKALLADPKNGLSSISPPLPLPLDARIHVTGVVPERSTIFKSNLFPLRLQFQCEDGDEYPVIFKNGDDLRQDQLVIQLITLMDRLLRKENLDLRMTPYRVLATDTVDGMVQFVPSMSLAAVMSEHGGSLLNYLKAHHPDDASPSTYGVSPAVLDTFIRSCAGYCVVTYLLGVGDRHLDNLLLSPDGHFFHVDFSYIFGRDPKPFPPPVKVSKEMVDAMGGTSSPHYGRFKSLCCTAFTSLRKSANLILNLIALMVDANVPDIKIEPDKAVIKVQDKFRLDLTEDDAIKHFDALLNETSYLSAVFDRIHDFAQYFRQ